MEINLESLKEGINYFHSEMLALHKEILKRNIKDLPDRTIVSTGEEIIFKYDKDKIVTTKKYKDLDYLLKTHKTIDYFIIIGSVNQQFLLDSYFDSPYKKILVIQTKPCEYLKLFNSVPDMIMKDKSRPSFVLHHDYSKTEHVGLSKLKKYVEDNKIHILGDTGISCKGITLMGVPGTGKTYSSKLIAKILDLPLYELDLTSIFNSLLGETENNVDQALSFLNHRCVVLLDEVDKFFNSGLKNTHFTHASSTSKLLKFMNNNDHVFFVMTANKSEGIPPEFMRKGRIDTHFYIDFPSSQELEAYAKHFVNRVKLKERTKNTFLSKVKPLYEEMEAKNYLFTDMEGYLKDLYTEYLNNPQEFKSFTLDLPVTDYEINKTKFTDIIKWSKDNARPAN